MGTRTAFHPSSISGTAHGEAMNPTKDSLSWQTIPDLELVDIAAPNGELDVSGDCVFELDPDLLEPLVSGKIRWAIDGNPVPNTERSFAYRTPSIGGLTPGELCPVVTLPRIRLTGLMETVTLAAQWYVSAGTAKAHGTHRMIQATVPAY